MQPQIQLSVACRSSKWKIFDFVAYTVFFRAEIKKFLLLFNPNSHGGGADSAPPTSHLLTATKVKVLAS